MKKYWMLGLFGGAALSLTTPGYTEGTVTSAIKNIEIGGQIRHRYEYRRPDTLLNQAGREHRESDDTVSLRTRLHAKLDFGDGISGKITLADSHTTGVTPVGTDDAGVTVHEGYMKVQDLFGQPLDLTVGRFVLHLGSARLVAHLNWAQQGRHWDGAQLRYNMNDRGYLDLIYTELVNGDVNSSGVVANAAGTAASADDDSDLYVLWLHQKLTDQFTLDAYSMLQDDGVSNNKSSEITALSTPAIPPKGIERWTNGAQLSFKSGGAYANIEGMWQDGHQGLDDIKANAWAAVAGYNLNENLTVEYEHIYASGDSDPGDGNLEGFQAPFGFFHKYHGWMDLVGFRNSINNNVKVKYKIDDKTKLTLAYHWHQREDRDDNWYGANGVTVVRSGIAGSNTVNPLDQAQKSASGSNSIGQEFNLGLSHKYSKNLSFTFFYGHFFEGALARETGHKGDQDWYSFNTDLKF